MNVDQVAIIGAGPAGLATALQLHRYGIASRVFEKTQIGGLLRNANWVENYPGFPKGISGVDLANLFCEQAKAWGIHITKDSVQYLEWDEGEFKISTLNGIYRALTVVIASGTQPRRFTEFDIPPELKERVFYEIVSLLSCQNQRLLIVGAGDAAFDYGLNLAKQNQVIIIYRGEQVKCLPLLWERAIACKNINIRPGVAISKLITNPKGGMIVECFSPEGPLQFQADYLIGAIGRLPQMDFVSTSVLEHASEFENTGILHFVGDVRNGIFRQTAIAIGNGIRAAMRLNQVLKETPDESDCIDRKRRHSHCIHRRTE